MNYEARRQSVFGQMEDNSLLILYSGAALHRSADAYYLFEQNKNFFYRAGRPQRRALDGQDGHRPRSQGDFRH